MTETLYSTGVRKLVDDYLLEESKKIRDYGKYWSASSAGYCMRKSILERLKVPYVEKEQDARLQRVFTSGHIFHSWIQGVTKDAGVSVAQEDELVDEKLMVKGHFDDLIQTEKGLLLIDYKTVNSNAFKYKKDTPSHYHTMQLGTYLYMLRKDHKDLAEARITLISKDDLRMKDQPLLWTPALEKKVVEYWTTLNGYWKKKQLPKCTCGDYEINAKTGVGFMADERYNPFFYEGEPCSLAWAKKTQEEGLWEFPDEG